jgi:shikimate dehydrogenase
MALRIRQATADDYERLCALWAELDALHSERLPQLFQQAAGPARAQDYYAGLLADENAAMFVAEAGDALAGFVHVLVREPAPMPIFVPRRYAVVDGLAVTAAFRHQGVGRLLMDSAQRWAAARGAGAIELNVYAFNETAIAFYRSLGYEIYSVRMSRALAAPTTGRQPDAEKAHP